MTVDYWCNKLNGLCTKCNNTAESGVYCYRHRLTAVYYNIYHRCNNTYKYKKNKSYEGKELGFTREEFIEWGMSNKPLNISRPSIGRIDHDKGYFLDNIQWEELSNNSRKHCKQIDIDEGYKKCPNCDIVFEMTTEYFHVNKSQYSGLSSWCKKCNNKTRTIRRKQNV